jgi:molecular chaperone DnaK (HSP70)
VINIGGKTSEASALRVANGQISRITGYDFAVRLLLPRQIIDSLLDPRQHKADFGFEEFERRMMEHVLRTFADTYGMDASESSEAVQQVHTFLETNFMDIFAQGTLEVSFNDFYGSKPLEQKLFVEELELLNNDYLRIIEQMASDVASESGQKFGYYVDRVVIAGAVAHMKPLVDKLHAQFPTKFMDDAQLHVPSEKRIAHVRTPCICPLLWFVPDS